MYPDPDKRICPRSRQTPRLPFCKENRPHETSAGTRPNSTHPLAQYDPTRSTPQLLVYYTQYTTFNQQTQLWETLPRPLTFVLPHLILCTRASNKLSKTGGDQQANT
ncbi:unnamed protein product [Ectocarpus sp. 8 AP-2014]